MRAFDLPYSPLYDAGYTSLGKTTNTLKNPALCNADGSYKPAWQLGDESLERAGRISSKPKAEVSSWGSNPRTATWR